MKNKFSVIGFSFVYNFTKIILASMLCVLGGCSVSTSHECIDHAFQIEMVKIPGGEMRMSDGKVIQIQPFWISKYEITWQQYKLFLDEHAQANQAVQLSDRQSTDVLYSRVSDAESINALHAKYSKHNIVYIPTLPEPAWFNINDKIDKNAVSMVSRIAAQQYTKWLSFKSGKFYRLPTELEWELACKFKNQKHAADIDKTSYAWFYGNTLHWDDKGPGAVGEKKANLYGLHDMLGNAKEWVLGKYRKDMTDADTHFDNQNFKSLFKLVECENETAGGIVKGGSYLTEEDKLKCTNRWYADTDWRFRDIHIPQNPWWYPDAEDVGFRIVRPDYSVNIAEQEIFWDFGLEQVIQSLTSMQHVIIFHPIDVVHTRSRRKPRPPAPVQNVGLCDVVHTQPRRKPHPSEPVQNVGHCP